MGASPGNFRWKPRETSPWRTWLCCVRAIFERTICSSVTIICPRSRAIAPHFRVVTGLEIGNSAALDLRDFTQCQVVLLANGRVIASSLARPDLNEPLTGLFQQALGAGRTAGPRKVELADEHYFCSAGAFTSLSQEGKLG